MELRAFVDHHLDAGTHGFPPGPPLEPAAGARSTEHAPPPLLELDRDTPARPRPRVPQPPPGAALPPVGPFLAEGDRVRRLEVVDELVRGCRRCDLHQSRTRTAFARGTPEAELCFVGEGPGAEEDAQGVPFVGPAGQLLDRMIAAMGYARDEVYVCNAVKCRPPSNRKPEPQEVGACFPYLAEQLAIVAPKVIVALGATAAESLLGAPVAITRARGQWRLYRGSIPLMLTFHPAYLLRQPAAKRDVWQDLQAVLEKLGRPRRP